MYPIEQHSITQTRRVFFAKSAAGIGTAALGSLLGANSLFGQNARDNGMPDLPHFGPKAKRVIYLLQMVRRRTSIYSTINLGCAICMVASCRRAFAVTSV